MITTRSYVKKIITNCTNNTPPYDHTSEKNNVLKNINYMNHDNIHELLCYVYNIINIISIAMEVLTSNSTIFLCWLKISTYFNMLSNVL